MFELQFDKALSEKFAPYFKQQDKVLLDLDDGIGQFSNSAVSCTMGIAMRIIIVPEDLATPDHTIEVKTNLGSIYAKAHTEYALDKNMTLSLVPPFNQMVLKGDEGTIDPSVVIINKVSDTIKS